MVAEGSVGAIPLVTDCEHVSNGAAAPVADPAGAAAAAFLEAPNDDMWRRLAACLPGVRWVPAHLEALGDEVAPTDWRSWRGSRREAARRARELECLRVVHDVFANVEVAALAAARGRFGGPARSRRYLRIGEFVRVLAPGGA